MDAKTIGNSIFQGGIEGFVVSLMHGAGKIAQEQGQEYLKSKVFGLGTNDENLFLSACSYAVKKKLITSEELLKVCKVIDSYTPSQRSRIIGTLSKGEEEVAIESEKIGDDGNVVVDPKTNEAIMDKIKFKANIKGAEILGLLGKLNEEEIKKIFNSSGAAASVMDDLRKQKEAIDKILESSQFKKDAENFFTKETWLERKLREEKLKRGII